MSSLFAPALALLLLWPPTPPQSPNAVTQETTMTLTVDRVDRATRAVVFHGPDGLAQSAYVDRGVSAFDDLKAGDVVIVRYLESVIVQVRPDAKPTAVRDSTAEARKAGGEGVLQQINLVVTVEAVDPESLVVTYRTHDNRRVMRAVRDRRLLDGVKPGDKVEVTLTRMRVVSIVPSSR